MESNIGGTWSSRQWDIANNETNSLISGITDMPLDPTPRDEQEWCLYYRDGSCRACVKKCVNDAFRVDDNGVWTCDKFKCDEQIYTKKDIPHYDIGDGDACGKCMCDVPCSLSLPFNP